MNIKSFAKGTTCALGLALLCSTAQASQTDISVWANIDPLVELLKADGSPLQDSVQLTYRPGAGLIPWEEQVRVFANDDSKDIEVRLAGAASLNPTIAGSGAVAVPLAVKLNNRPLTTTSITFAANELFPGSSMDGASVSMPLNIAQATPAAINVAGRYEGVVSVVLAQSTITP